VEQRDLTATLRSDDPAVGLRAVGALHRLAEQIEARSVRAARERGWSWEQIGDALGEGPPAPFGRRLPPMTSGTRAVFKRAIEEARRVNSGRVGAAHFLLALLSLRRPDPAAELLDALGVDPAAVRKRVRGPAGGEAG
jgi:hypothetical protein